MIRLGALSLDWSPLLPWPVLAGLAGLALLVVALGAWRRARGITLRALALALLLLTLANPSLLQEDRRYLDDVAVLLVDDSQSQQIERRPAQTAAAVAEIARRVKALGGVELRIVHAGGAARNEPAPEGTRLFGTLAAVQGAALLLGYAIGGVLGGVAGLVVTLSAGALLRVLAGVLALLLLPRDEGLAPVTVA